MFSLNNSHIRFFLVMFNFITRGASVLPIPRFATRGASVPTMPITPRLATRGVSVLLEGMVDKSFAKSYCTTS